MDISSAISRIQKLGDLIEKLIKQSNEMRERVIDVEDNVERASQRIAVVEVKLERQSALVEAIAAEEGIDIEAVYERAGLDGSPEELAAERIQEAESDGNDDETDVGVGDAGGNGESATD